VGRGEVIAELASDGWEYTGFALVCQGNSQSNDVVGIDLPQVWRSGVRVKEFPAGASDAWRVWAKPS
jgi:hypothetical protein